MITRRFFTLGLGCTALAACDNTRELGAGLDEGGFGNPTAHNHLVLTGQMPYVVNLAERFAAEVPTTVNFAFDSVHLDAEAQSILRRQAHWIRQFPEVTFRVFGHTDLVGSAAYNHQLGLRRARAVVNALVRHGISRARLEALVSHGQTQPLIFTQARERQNRRTVTEVSGFMQRHPTVLNGQYAQIIYREYVESATRERPPPYL
ncbi:MAG: OmpA family protein [Pararhodobacter sp.]|nr:OmpA family protein [Pararhodobacter sp.]